MGLVGADADRADLVAGDMPATAQKRQNPARIGVLPAAYVHPEPDHVLEAGAMALLPVRLARLGRVLDKVLGLRHGCTVRVDQRGGDVLGAALAHQARGQRAILIVELDRLEHGLEQALAILAPRSIDSTRLRRG
jgi:hypothetical protein